MTENETYQDQLSPCSYPKHILDEDGEPVCGIDLSADIASLIEDYPDTLWDLHEFVDDNRWAAIPDLCGNCLRVHLFRNDDPLVQEMYDGYQNNIANVGGAD
ncbi:hypothetical protein [Natrinema pallidum]|uniref:Uncharacterized protein n=1 Tax=Natrinema pallidum TaxID=69527 RepID=A0A4P9TJV4_9EURY|nr:hypothetical protein [Natrinema pallidum]QCW05291.1 hypothetical protein FGF80_18795 [Natrinema pallidum]